MHRTPALAALAVFALAGCATSKPTDTEFALVDEITVQAPFDTVWQAAKAVLRERELLIYTRDKRGLFVAFTNQHRRRLIPRRTQFTVTLASEGPSTTRVTVETAVQEYGVSLLTYPGWINRPTEDHTEALAILEGIKGKSTGVVPSAPSVTDTD